MNIGNIPDFFYNNGDVLRAIVSRAKDRGAFSSTDTRFYQAIHYEEEKGGYSQLQRSLNFILKQEETLSAEQKTDLEKFLPLVDRAVKELSQGPDAVQIGGDDLNRIKRAVAVILSGNPQCVEKLPIPQNIGLVRELRDVARAYTMLLEYLQNGDKSCPLNTIVAKFHTFPRHYLQHVLDLLETQQDITPRYVLSFLLEIHNVLCEDGDMSIAHLIFGKISDFLKKRMSHPEPGIYNPQSDTALLLGLMLVRERLPKVAVEILNELYSGKPLAFSFVFIWLIGVTIRRGDYDGAVGLVEACTPLAGPDFVAEMYKVMQQEEEKRKQWGVVANRCNFQL